MQSWFLKRNEAGNKEKFSTLSSQQIYDFILQKFRESIAELSFANRIVFYHEYIICLNTEDYKDFMDSKKGIFGLIVNEAVNEFYRLLKALRSQGKIVEPSSTKWIFPFVAHPDYARGDKGFIGKLLPDSSLQKEQNLRITYIPRQTGIAQTFDINPDILKGFHFTAKVITKYLTGKRWMKKILTGKTQQPAPVQDWKQFCLIKPMLAKKLSF